VRVRFEAERLLIVLKACKDGKLRFSRFGTKLVFL
jgi:hypothetical protein